MEGKDIFTESLSLFNDMEDITRKKPGEIELQSINEAEKEEGITRKIKYDMPSGARRMKFTYAGNIVYINIPTILSNKDEIYSFVSSILQKVNPAIYPARFVNVYEKVKEKEEPKPEETLPGKEEKPKEEE